MFRTFLIFCKWILFMFWFSWNYKKIKVDKSYAVSLKSKLENLGIIGIKLGQYLCNRRDVCSDIMKEELKSFLSSNKVHSFMHTKQILDKAGVNDLVIGDIIGSGSLTQTYLCTKEGSDRKLVLKVMHPEVRTIIHEISALKSILKAFSYFGKFKTLVNVDWNKFFFLIEQQTDLDNEKKYMKKYFDIYTDKLPEIEIPEFIQGNSDYILMSFCEGRQLNEIPRDSELYARAHNKFACSFVHTFFIHQIIHGDIHEGNILVKDNGDISMIDFGICIELTEQQYKGIFATSRFENEPSMETSMEFIKAVIEPWDVFGNMINMKQLCKDSYEEYVKACDGKIQTSINNFFNSLIIFIQKYNVLMKGEILSYFLNMILIEGLSPCNERINMSGFKAVVYMKKHPFYLDEMDFLLDEYYGELKKKFPQDLIEKYDV